jgi:hypothetical protein
MPSRIGNGRQVKDEHERGYHWASPRHGFSALDRYGRHGDSHCDGMSKGNNHNPDQPILRVGPDDTTWRRDINGIHKEEYASHIPNILRIHMQILRGTKAKRRTSGSQSGFYSLQEDALFERCNVPMENGLQMGSLLPWIRARLRSAFP